MDHYPRTPEECEQLDRETEELDRGIEELELQMERDEAERWARIEKKERAADILSTLSLVFSIIVLLITLAK